MHCRSVARRRIAVALLAAMSCVVLAASFHLGSDNDFARVAPRANLSLQTAARPATDDCPACLLEGLASAVQPVCAPIATLFRAGGVQPLTARILESRTPSRLATRAPPAA